MDLSLKLTEITEKNNQLENNVNTIAIQNDLREKYKAKEGEFLKEIRNIDKEKAKLQQRLTEAENQIIQSGSTVDKIKAKDEELMEDLMKEMKRKEGVYEQSIKKVQVEKRNLQEQIEALKEEVQN